MQIMQENYSTLLQLLKGGASIEDLQFIAPLEELEHLRQHPDFMTEGGFTDWSKLNAHLCRKYYVSEATLWRAKKRLEREIDI